MTKQEDEYWGRENSADWSDALNVLGVFGIFVLAGLITVGFIALIRWLILLLANIAMNLI